MNIYNQDGKIQKRLPSCGYLRENVCLVDSYVVEIDNIKRPTSVDSKDSPRMPCTQSQAEEGPQLYPSASERDTGHSRPKECYPSKE